MRATNSELKFAGGTLVITGSRESCRLTGYCDRDASVTLGCDNEVATFGRPIEATQLPFGHPGYTHTFIDTLASGEIGRIVAR